MYAVLHPQEPQDIDTETPTNTSYDPGPSPLGSSEVRASPGRAETRSGRLVVGRQRHASQAQGTRAPPPPFPLTEKAGARHATRTARCPLARALSLWSRCVIAPASAAVP
ncbi:hypothetical protein CALCODRAFT_504706 [Calocera cornea HHB12733]|uniref:Uncharacterized protein n=1 Tax=Calocera cornea HHB12733 TaxID=1353952 RepID=A0A165C9Q8_9BASI|nr:hypothetical protein CALCODRAFT_504706 [Calocera cornea HHB12733]